MELETFLEIYEPISKDFRAMCADVRRYARNGNKQRAEELIAYVHSDRFPDFTDPSPEKRVRLFYVKNRLRDSC
ncbi:hypothetical protein HN419_05215 [Candidatus Woesearchaeota archaeon]|jgi:hypothetical protein|nr:hypothetical protein [Candidatus Woesearchaeota archaeon]MBT3537729.1 hypothetical protein [Candidatus Woesearchaeota archaeon]MBT4697860.1 hypothetical protein [Candidatus Woesearchaeota archaeon]MBT4717480.1 hypothetical protein [Candidatus Woesearchaeota archaeon]MBT7105398.1 hypothetical protein [Candidatus Woesearchaeota archaeon]